MPRKNLSTSYSPQSNDKPFEARKSLGQHFLRDTTALASIVSAAELSPKDVVLEVGPGEGVLTEALLKKTKKVVAIEKDHRLIEFLQERFKKEMEENRFSLIHEDILEVDLDSLSRSLGIKKGRYKVVANIPYYITGKLIRKFLTSDTHPSDMVLLLQKEVAE
ncbi:MAG: rRNA adenine dimethyltransferase family protein, partial [Candidatus Paceibacterota bacterium]